MYTELVSDTVSNLSVVNDTCVVARVLSPHRLQPEFVLSVDGGLVEPDGFLALEVPAAMGQRNSNEPTGKVHRGTLDLVNFRTNARDAGLK